MITLDNRVIKAALFDMDGTMFDTERLRFKTIQQAARELAQVEFALPVLEGSLGLSEKRAEALAKQHYGEAFPYEAIRKRADDLELAHVRAHGVPLKPGLKAVLERLRRNGLRMAVATSSRRAIAQEYLINADVFRYFDSVVCGDEVQHGKPDPEIFLKAAQMIGAEMDSTLIFEDSANGLRAAVAAGGLPVYVRDIKDPPEGLQAQCLLRYTAGMEGFLDDLRRVIPAIPEPRLVDPFPIARNDDIVGIHGFGAIGGGLLAQVFSHWDGYTRPAEIIGVTGDRVTRELVNALGRYTVRYDTRTFDQVIRNIRLIDTADEAAIIDMYLRARIVGLALPERAIAGVAPVVAKGLLARHREKRPPLVILTILNKIGGAGFVAAHLRKALEALSPQEAEAVMAKISFPELVVNRIVSRVSSASLSRQTRIKLRPLLRPSKSRSAPDAGTGPVFDESWLEEARGKLGYAAEQARRLERVSFVLFHSEPDMLVFSERGDRILTELRQLRLVDDIRTVQTIKNRLWNGPHAIMAWYGDLLGHRSIGQAMADGRVSSLIERLIREEVAPSLATADPTTKALIPDFIDTFLDRCRGSFSDTCRRVGRDPLRKLQRHERILASIFAAKSAGLPTASLEFGVALGLHYALCHPDEGECRAINEVYLRRDRIEDVLCSTERIRGSQMPSLDPHSDTALITAIADAFNALGNVQQSQEAVAPNSWAIPTV